jgi:hypothetical protein
LQEKRDKPNRITRSKHSYQYARTTNEKYDKKEKTARKFNNNKVSYHSTSTQQLEKRHKKTKKPSKLNQQTPNSTNKPKKLMCVTV